MVGVFSSGFSMFSCDLVHFTQDPGQSGAQIDGNMGAAQSHLRASVL